jgi:hypothetical protein
LPLSAFSKDNFVQRDFSRAGQQQCDVAGEINECKFAAMLTALDGFVSDEERDGHIYHQHHRAKTRDQTGDQ